MNLTRRERRRKFPKKLQPAALTLAQPGGGGSETLKLRGTCSTTNSEALCGKEAICEPVKDEVGFYTCTCSHDFLPATADVKTGGLTCRRRTVPLTRSLPIYVNLPATSVTSRNVTAAYIDSFKNISSAEASVLLAVIAALLAIFSALCCWKWRNITRCCALNPKLTKTSQNGLPLSLSKGLLATDRYAPNPQYTPCSLNELSSPLPVPLLHRDHINFLQEVGEGFFGKVYKGELKTETCVETVAIKVLKETATREAEDDFMREVEIMSAFKHPNILTLIGIALKEPNRSPWMVFEYMPHGDLTEVLRSNSRTFWSGNTSAPRLNKESLLRIALQIAQGMAYLAAQRFVHRDLACRNCLVGEDLCVKIADFGMSRDVYTCDYYKIGGSRLMPVRWMSPESVMYGRFTLESDVWSYGVVLWEIYSLGKQPYFGHSNEEVVRLILQGIMLIAPEDCPPFICELMKACWKTEAKDRTSFPAILDTLQSAAAASSPPPPTTLPRPPAFPVTPHTATEVLDCENYLKPLPTEAKEYLQTLPDIE